VIAKVLSTDRINITIMAKRLLGVEGGHISWLKQSFCLQKR